jgi:hypothetical protein
MVVEVTISIISLRSKLANPELCHVIDTPCQGSNFIAAIAVEGEQNAVDHCGNDGNFLPYSAIFILFTVYYYFDT